LDEKKLLKPGMVSIRKWNFRQAAPIASNSQDLVVFSLTGNYSTIEEQPLILREIARCVKQGEHLIASTMTPKLDFDKARSPLNIARLVLTNPLSWPILHEFASWQRKWGEMAGKMMQKGFWENTTGQKWAAFIEPAGMETVRIYPGPVKLLPVEVLVTRKK